MPAWTQRTALSGASIARNGTTTHTCAFATPAAGALLVAVVGGAVTFTTPAGWTKLVGPVNNNELDVFYKASAAGTETNFVTTHNGSNYPIAGVVYEFPPGSTMLPQFGSTIALSMDAVAAGPACTGITASTYTRFAARTTAQNDSPSTAATTWTLPSVEDFDSAVPSNNVTDGIALTIAYDDGASGSSFTPSATTTTTNVLGGPAMEGVSFGVVPAGAPVTITRNPTAVRSAGTWVSSANALGAPDNVYATNTGATQNTEYPIDLGTFDFSVIPTGSTGIAVRLLVEIKAGTASRSQWRFEVYDGATLVDSNVLANIPTTETSGVTATLVTMTLARLKSANMFVRIVNKRTASQANTTSLDAVTLSVDYTPPSTPPVALTPDEPTHSDSVDATSIVQVPSLVPLEPTHGDTVDIPALTQVHKLAPLDLAHSDTVDIPALSQAHVLSPAEPTHSDAVDTTTIVRVVALAPAEPTHGDTVDISALAVTYPLVPVEPTHADTVDVTALTQIHQLAPLDLAHGSTADIPALTQVHQLSPAEPTHADAVDTTSISLITALVPSDLAHSDTVDASALVLTYSLAPLDAAHADTVDIASAVITRYLAPLDLAHPSSVDATGIAIVSYLAPLDLAHPDSADAAALALTSFLAPLDAAHPDAADATALTQAHALAPLDTAHTDTVDIPAIVITRYLAPLDLAHGDTVDVTSLTQSHILGPLDTAHTDTVSASALSAPGSLAPIDARHTSTVESPALTQAHKLAPLDVAHPDAVDIASIVVLYALAPLDAAHPDGVDAASIVVIRMLAPDDARHADTVDGPLFELAPSGSLVMVSTYIPGQPPAWLARPLMRWDGSAWVPALMSRWDGAAWVAV